MPLAAMSMIVAVATVPKFNLVPRLLAVPQDCISANKHVTLHRSHARHRDVTFSLSSTDSSFAPS